MGGGQRIEEVQLKSWKEIDWGKPAGYWDIDYGTSYRFPSSKVKNDELVLSHFNASTGVLTYYQLPPIVHRIAERSFNDGKRTAKDELKKWFTEL